MIKKILLICLILTSSIAFSKSKKKYEYKKYERFDFEALDVEGSNTSPGDLSIGPRFKKKFRNKIPERKNFNREMKRAIDSII
jgi:hypothetical protein